MRQYYVGSVVALLMWDGSLRAALQARLIPAVEKYCESRGIPYRRIADQGTGHVGIIDVSLATLEQGDQNVSHVLR